MDDLIGLVRGILQRYADEGGRFISEDYEERVFGSFKSARALADSPRLPNAIEARLRLLGEARRLCDGIVLHANRVVTLHVNAKLVDRRVTIVVGSGGLQGIQVRTDTGQVGLVTADAAAGFVRPTPSGLSKTGADAPPWRVENLEDALSRIRIVYSPDGDWQTVSFDPTLMVEIIARADTALHSLKNETAE